MTAPTRPARATKASPAVALIGGLDPSGGAGLLRDCWTVARRAPELERLAVCTALTRQAEGPGQSLRVAATAPDILARELARLEAHPRLRAVKIGMVPVAAIAPLVDFLDRLRARPDAPPVVLDPVADASEGGRLGAPADALMSLIARVELLTPNRDERAELEAIAPLEGPRLLKGEAVPERPELVRDRFIDRDRSVLLIERPRVAGPDPRGTGCALASAIAAELARARSLRAAVVSAVAWLDGARRLLRPTRDGRWMLA